MAATNSAEREATMGSQYSKNDMASTRNGKENGKSFGCRAEESTKARAVFKKTVRQEKMRRLFISLKNKKR
jgi:hypothetical protein